ncbi:GHMP kinase [Pseudodesulfovibrio sp. JC047]|uniref:beta-ribofuranosylaminobenzene 5'-phosphate synthase family protein n=1 Tax=Pseudodesulfovibrio sp. JC047 TaxID=2683199 RepID=UPI0013D66489|nr:beta-ribofuranosylaminobenzene 5'-phosphate synthase family protein [Pseudodesulfovibrio sp. JC047]NDV19439.1 GHMP kinase [Pseudodesulfovibrio sp. JC047]
MKITVTAHARLHFGFTNLTPELGTVYGSVGVGLKEPFTRITATSAADFSVHGPRSEQVAEYATRLAKQYGIAWNAHLMIEDTIDRHSGLGSGTQTALATAAALLHLHGMDCDIRTAAGALDRGLRSGVGIATFESGGFILDGGHQRLDRPEVIVPSNVLVHHDFPEDWHFVLFLPAVKPGLSGKNEGTVFHELGDTRAISDAICRTVLLNMLPALINKDIEAFGTALTEVDTWTGHFFNKAQGGTYREALAHDAVENLLSAGAYGVGQSSWGPCLYGLVDSRTEQSVVRAGKEFLTAHGLDGTVRVVRPNNSGATIRVDD